MQNRGPRGSNRYSASKRHRIAREDTELGATSTGNIKPRTTLYIYIFRERERERERARERVVLALKHTGCWHQNRL